MNPNTAQTKLATTLLAEPYQIDSLPQLVTPLLNWFQAASREMPWRTTPTPYYVWVSEIMLQQTRVEAVRGYFQRFITQYPTIPSLAAAEDQQLLKLWEGLGYYNRARNLKKAALQLVEHHNGQLPPDYDQLLTLPGIGPYTAGAIGSIAFGLATPAVDGNVYRVLSRVLASTANTSQSPVQKAYQQLVAAILPPQSPGDFNQSLMELGALVCRPVGLPYCDQCPIEPYCASTGQDWVLDLPVKNPAKGRKREHRTILLVTTGTQILLTKRPTAGLLGDLWQPLNLKGTLTKEELASYLAQLTPYPYNLSPLPTSSHIFSHIQWEMTAWLVKTPYFPPPAQGEWVSSTHQHPLPSAFSAYRPQIETILRGSNKLRECSNSML